MITSFWLKSLFFGSEGSSFGLILWGKFVQFWSNFKKIKSVLLFGETGYTYLIVNTVYIFKK